jgi:predicted ATP-grasp superfamily ATP-dependent carboligase
MTIGVVGASARAAVHSLARAGLDAWAVDLFVDRDLARVAPCMLCPAPHYPTGLPALAQQFPPGRILYTGGLENHPEVVAELAAKHELWGNSPTVLRSVRNPYQLSATLQAHRILTPQLLPLGKPVPSHGVWLSKPIRGAGGIGIRYAQPGERPHVERYVQEFVAGEALSAVYVDQSLFGVTQQLIGESWVHARAFTYCGSIGPIPLSSSMREQLLFLGEALHDVYKIQGVWNVDVVVNEGRVFVVEVNPRYSASVEVLEHALGRAALGSGPADAAATKGTAAKAVYYAPRRLRFPKTGPWEADLNNPFDPWRIPTYADIPAPGSIIELAHPVLSVLLIGSSAVDCRRQLQSRACELDRLLLEHGHDTE